MGKLFAYGTLLDPKVQQEVFGMKIAGTYSRIRGYIKIEITIDAKQYPALVVEPEGVVDGSVLELTESELVQADDYEGPEYRRARALLAEGDEAWVYLAKTRP